MSSGRGDTAREQVGVVTDLAGATPPGRFRVGSWARALGLVVVALWLGSCKCEGDSETERPRVEVLRVTNPSDEAAGAEHCIEPSQCVPVAPGQKLEPRGFVRTRAGGAVTLLLSPGRELFVGNLSQVSLASKQAELEQGDFTLETQPLITKEPLPELRLRAADQDLNLESDSRMVASFSVDRASGWMTLRRGRAQVSDQVVQAGQNLHLTQAGAFRTGPGGGGLPSLPRFGPSDPTVHALWSEASVPAQGLGTMTARLPNTEKEREGVHLSKHHVTVTIRDGFARTEIEEEFFNDTKHILEGRFRFPVPSDARLARLGLWVGDELIEGEVVERQRAARIYSSIVDRPVPRDPALLEWVSAGEMSLKVFPILPSNSRRLILAYDQVLPSEGGRTEYVYPLSLGPGHENAIGDFSITVRVEDPEGDRQGRGGRQLRVPSHPVELGREGKWQTAHYRAQGALAARDFVLVTQEPPRPVASLAGTVPNDEPGHFALRFSADPATERQAPSLGSLARAVIVDVSHSQSEVTLKAQRAAAWSMIEQLDDDESFLLLACDSACAIHAPTGESRGQQLESAREWLEGLSLGGASDLAGALVAASVGVHSKLRPGQRPQIVLLGDGQPSAGELSARAIADRTRPHLSRVDVRLVGVGRVVDRHALHQLAVALHAPLEVLDGSDDLSTRLDEVSFGLRRPVIEEPHLVLPAGLRSESAHSLPPLRLGQSVVIFGRLDRLPVDGSLSLEGRLAGQPYHLARSIEIASRDHPLVAGLWARERIGALQGVAQTAEVRQQILDISLEHGVVSPYSSLLVLESERMFEDHGITRNQKDRLEESKAFEARPGAPSQSSDELTDSFSSDGGKSPAARVRAAPDPSSGSGAVSRPSSSSRPVAPAPMPKPKPMPMPSSAPRPSGAPAAAEEAPALADADDNDQPPPIPAPATQDADGRWAGAFTRMPPPRFRPRRAHLVHSTADDAWRDWAAERLNQLAQDLEQQPRSRSAFEAFIRGHLQHGRFGQAERVARQLVQLDPDYDLAHELLASAAVVSGNHELARQMLDVRVESAPRDLDAHAEAARAFDSVGDVVRSCAHFRSLAELAPELEEAQDRAEACWNAALGEGTPVPSAPDERKRGQFEVEVRCADEVAAEDCPAPVVVTPDGRVVSPWTPGVGRSTRHRISFVKLRTGTYWILVAGGAPGARGRVALTGRHESRTLPFEGGQLHTVAKTQVDFR